jgi:glycosyltransferase involved in cell wall biosynthesis
LPHVSIFLPTLEGGGAERAMIYLAHGMCELGREVDLVVGKADGPYVAEIGTKIRLVDLKAQRLLFALPGLVRYLRQRPPTCLYSALGEANIVALWARSLARVPVPIIPGLRNNLSREMEANPTLKNRSMLHLARRLYPKADGIVAVSCGVADDAARRLDLSRSRITVIPNPVVAPKLFEMAAEPLHHPWFRTGQPPTILACGRLAPQKDCSTLLRAFARLGRSARLIILGEGEEMDALKRLAADLNILPDVDFLGFVRNPFWYMARAQVFVLSSIFEGSPNVLVQALACGCFVVATDCASGPREILDGVSGTSLVPVGDVAALAGAIERFLAPDMGRPGPRILQRFDRQEAAAAYLALAGA